MIICFKSHLQCCSFNCIIIFESCTFSHVMFKNILCHSLHLNKEGDATQSCPGQQQTLYQMTTQKTPIKLNVCLAGHQYQFDNCLTNELANEYVFTATGTYQRQSYFKHRCQCQSTVKERHTVHTQDWITVAVFLFLLRFFCYQQSIHGTVRILGSVQKHFTVSLARQLNRHVDRTICRPGK